MAKKIDITKVDELKNLTLKDLVDDAVARNDRKAVEFLKKESGKKTIKKKKDGTQYEASKGIRSIRSEYLETYLKYVPASAKSSEASKAKQRAKQKEKKEKAREELFANAFASLDKEEK